MHERLRLEQLGEVVIKRTSKDEKAGYLANVECIKDRYGYGRTEADAVVDLFEWMALQPHLADRTGIVAVWWDPRIQDWGTSPNAPDGWPAPAKNPDDIRARLDSVLEGIEVEYWHGRDYPSDDVHWTATAGEHTGYGGTQGEAYLDIWHDLKRKR